ncbi:MAG: penicillin-binding transpeptidase domain-containing protein [Planctomycetota bacterium]
MEQRSFASASGLRPTSAFVVVAIVILAVAGRVAHLAFARSAPPPDREVFEVGLVPAYEVADAGGRTLATFVPRFDLVMSPRSMWQAHTPVRMAQRISEVLGGEPTALELIDAMIPDATAGVIEVKAWELTPRQAQRLGEWMESGAGSGTHPLAGIWIRPLARHGQGAERFRLFWQPELLLSPEEREAHGYESAWSWSRHLAHGIERCRRRPGLGDPTSAKEWDARRAEVWAALIPRAHCRPVRGIPSAIAIDVRDLLREEGVSPWQMKLAYDRDRHYPCGEHELFGSWGFVDPAQTEARPREGLELLGDRLLEGAEWSFLGHAPDTYVWRRDRSVRGRRGDRANAYLGLTRASAAPIVHSTIDLALQRFVRRELQAVMTEHRPALAMAIVLDLESGDVLAVDSVEEYEIQPFAPVYHTFTPGSTMKVVTMATALEEGLVRPDDEFEVGDGSYHLVDPATGRGRVIHEAEGSLTGRNTAAMFFARSVNACFAQIGVRIPAEVFRRYLVALGYGSPPGAGLGIERAGYLRGLPWAYRFTHASVGFGHEMTTTLWQHAAALSTVVRGGVWRPLRLLRAVEQDGARHEIPLADGRRVYRPETCAEVRAMMVLGATEGTGRHLARPDIAMGTKTGTAQKVGTELCVHVELAARERADREGVPMTAARLRSLKAQPKPHGNCYTSSMCVFGRRLDEEREILVLVVADEPRSREKFGSRVAGPAAAAILVEALGLTRDGEPPVVEVVDGFGPSPSPLRNGSLVPWREEER